jgi:hypothetical protein
MAPNESWAAFEDTPSGSIGSPVGPPAGGAFFISDNGPRASQHQRCVATRDDSLKYRRTPVQIRYLLIEGMELNQRLYVYFLNTRIFLTAGTNGGNMHILLALAIYSFGLLNGALCVAFFEGAGRGRHSSAPQAKRSHCTLHQY